MARVRKGAESPRLPFQSQLAMPLMEALADAGGCAKPGEMYDEVARRIGLDDATRNATVTAGSAGEINAYERHLRWTRQTLVLRGLISREKRNHWELTDKANAKLGNIVRGAIVPYFETDNGIYLWGDALDVCAVLEAGSIDVLVSSPPYPIARGKNYQYGEDRSVSRWLDWMLKLCESWRGLLAPTGSMLLNLGPVFNPGEPTESLYVQRLLIRLEEALGIHLLQRLSYHSPNKLPTPMPWVAQHRVRVKPSVEPILWLSTNAWANADNRRVLNPYSKSALRAIANPQDGEKRRPSGFVFGPSSFVDNGGAIPSSLIVATNSASASPYRRAERAAGRVPHGAMMPDKVAEFCISLASDVGDTVYDPFGGAGTVPLAAERLKRRWIAEDRAREFCISAQINFEANGIHTRALAA